MGDYSISIKYAHEAVKTTKKNNYGKGLGFAYNNIGIINDYQGHYVDELDSYFKALKVQKKFKDEIGLAYTYSNIGLILFESTKLQGSIKKPSTSSKFTKKE